MEHKGVGPHPPSTTLLEPLQRCEHQLDDQTSLFLPYDWQEQGFYCAEV